MREIKLNGREQSVIRAIDYATGTSGAELATRTQIEPADLADLLHSLCDIGFVEPTPYTETISLANFAATNFEVNPAYAQQLKASMRRN